MKQLLLHLFELQSQLLLLKLLLLLLLVGQLLLPLEFFLLLDLIPNQLFLLLFDLLLLLLQARGNVIGFSLYLLLDDDSIGFHWDLALQHLLQSLDLDLILPNHRIFRILVDLWLVLDFLGFRGIAKGAHGFFVVVVSWSNVRNHNRLCVTSQRLLQ